MRLRLNQYPDGAMYFGVYEVRTTRLLRRLARPGDTVVDVGGNIGYISLHLSRHVGERGRVHTFEPVPENAQRLLENARLNGIGNIDLHPAAVGAEAGEIKMYTFGSSDNAQHVLASLSPLYEQRQELHCPVEVLDDVVDGPVRLIKIDVEGAEVGVLRGARHILRRYRPHLIVENNPETLAAFGHTFSDVLDAVREATDGYDVVEIDGWRRKTWSLQATASQLCSGNIWLRPKT